MKSSELIAMIEADGWKRFRIRGSHHQFKKDGVASLITISHPEKDLSRHQVMDARRKSGLKF